MKPINAANRAKGQSQYTSTAKSRLEYVYENLSERHEREKKENAQKNVTIRKKRPPKSPQNSPSKPPTHPNVTLRRSKRQKL